MVPCSIATRYTEPILESKKILFQYDIWLFYFSILHFHDFSMVHGWSRRVHVMDVQFWIHSHWFWSMIWDPSTVFFYLFFQKVNFFSTKIFTHCIKSCFYYGPPQARFFLLFLWFFVDFPLKNEAKLRKFRPRVQKVYLLASQKVNFLPFWNPKGKKVYPKR